MDALDLAPLNGQDFTLCLPGDPVPNEEIIESFGACLRADVLKEARVCCPGGSNELNSSSSGTVEAEARRGDVEEGACEVTAK